MNKKHAIITTIFVAGLMILFWQSYALAENETHVGYLSDVLCAENGESAGGFDLTANPEKHTVACMKMPPCIASGYGIFIQNAESGKYEFVEFDEKGTELAKKLLDNTAKADDVRIQVSGSMEHGRMKVESLTAA